MQYITITNVESAIFELLDNVPRYKQYEEFHDVLDLCKELKRDLMKYEDDIAEVKVTLNKIGKYISKYHFLQEQFEGGFGFKFDNPGHIHEDDASELNIQLKEKLPKYKHLSKLFDKLKSDTSVYKTFLIIREIFYPGEDIDDEIKNFLKLHSNTLKEYKIKTLDDLTKVSRKEWYKIIEETKDREDINIKTQMQEVAYVLYPQYMFNIDADLLMAGAAWSVKYPNQKMDIIGDIIEEDEYNKIYHGFNIPEAPPAPFPFEKIERKEGKESDWEKEFEEYRPYRQKHILNI